MYVQVSPSSTCYFEFSKTSADSSIKDTKTISTSHFHRHPPIFLNKHPSPIMGGFFDYVTSSAVSLTVSGNTGISPFLTLFLVGIIEISDPELLNMDGTIEKILASWYSIAIFGLLTVLEFIGKCVPVIDEFIDSVEIFIVPIFSTLGSLGSLGLLDLAAEVATGGGRQLSAGGTALTILKVILVIVGICLALLIHLFKMLIRLVGLTCCAGCCQPFITVVETGCVLTGVLVAIFVREIAIVTAIFLFIAAGYVIKKSCCSKTDEEGQPAAGSPANTGNLSQDTNNSNKQKEDKPDEEIPAQNSTGIVVIQPSAPAEEYKIDDVIPIPPPAMNPDYVDEEAANKSAENPVVVAQRVK